MKEEKKKKKKKCFQKHKKVYKRYSASPTSPRRCFLDMGIDWQGMRQNIINTKQKMLDKILKLTSELDYFENWEGKIPTSSITEIWKSTQQRNQIAICRTSFFYYLKLMKKAKIIKNSYYFPLEKDGKRKPFKPGVFHYIEKGENLKRAFKRLHSLIFKPMIARITSYKKTFALGILKARQDLGIRIFSFEEIIDKFYLKPREGLDNKIPFLDEIVQAVSFKNLIKNY